MTYDLSNINQLNRTEPPYLAAFGLAKAPFSSQHEESFFYVTPSLADQLKLLKHYTQYGNLLLIIKGERGIGKSSVKQHFIADAQEEWKTCVIQADTMMDSSRLLRDIAVGFGITSPPLDATVLYEVLTSQLEYLNQDAYEPILIIDDAHELPKESLQSLFYLAEHHSGSDSTLRTILFCEPEIDIMLEDPAIHALKDRVTHSIELEPLDEVQTAEYLRHRLAVAGFDGASPFTPNLIHKIYSAAEGIPEKINEYAHLNLLDDSEPLYENDFDQEPEQEMVKTNVLVNLSKLIFGGLAVTAIVAGLLYQDEINRFIESPEMIVKTTMDNLSKAAELTNDLNKTEKNTNKQSKSEITFTPKATHSVEQKTTETKKVNIETAVINKEKPTVTSTLKLISVNPNPVATSSQRQIISIIGKGFHKRQQVKINWTGNEKILDENQVNVTSDSYMNLILSVGMKTDTWSVTVTDPELKISSNTISFNVINYDKEPDKKTINQNKAEKDNGIYDQTWIRQQNPNHFTLQLLGTYNKTTPPRYLKQYKLKGDAAIFTRKIKGKSWNTLIYGSYATKQEALNAASNLPKGMAKPWARSFASIIPTLSKISATKIITKPSKKSSAKIVLATPAQATTIPKNKDGWLWSQDPSHYTLQLTAGTNEAAINTFITRHKLKNKAAYFSRTRDGKNWYILIYGRYDGLSKAKQAIGQLPSTMQKIKPWARSFSAIHAELN